MNPELKLALLMATSLLRRDNRANTADALELLVAREIEQKADMLAALMQLRDVAARNVVSGIEISAADEVIAKARGGA